MTPQLSFLVTRSSKLSQEVWRGMSVGLGLGLGAGLWLEGNHAQFRKTKKESVGVNWLLVMI
ncbi:hypothetical protein E2C01_004422 [Portunus trituberculatus]|uniref:Uncharacterized protein n=1 Tax=Portunus trituberculatus TaxID=210409 RepID=A0A5B7CPT2_PORTR|nr:hypothetical protein [Portunus trituberculatus]